MPPKRILFVDHTPFAGGGQLVLAEHIAELDKLLFEPHVACTDTVPDLISKYRAAGAVVHVVAMPRLRGFAWRAPWQCIATAIVLRRLIGEQHIQLVVANTTRVSYFLALATVGLPAPTIWWVRDFLYPKRLFNWLKFIPRRVIFVSKAVRDFYDMANDPKSSVLYVASNLYRDLEGVTDSQLVSEQQKYHLDGNVVVGFMGRLVAEKGPEDVVEAVASLVTDYPSVRLLVVGTGKDQLHDVEAKLHHIVEQRGLKEVITFTGYQHDQALYYKLFDIFVLATRDGEPFATSVVQAMMAGAKVVGTAVGGTPELVVDGQTGWLYPPGDAITLAGVLRTIIDHPAQADMIAKAGQERVLQYHREEQLARQAEQLYTEVLADKEVV